MEDKMKNPDSLLLVLPQSNFYFKELFRKDFIMCETQNFFKPSGIWWKSLKWDLSFPQLPDTPRKCQADKNPRRAEVPVFVALRPSGIQIVCFLDSASCNLQAFACKSGWNEQSAASEGDVRGHQPRRMRVMWVGMMGSRLGGGRKLLLGKLSECSVNVDIFCLKQQLAVTNFLFSSSSYLYPECRPDLELSERSWKME